MKTRHIIAIGLLSALAVGILGLAIHTGKPKAKTLQTNAQAEKGYIYNVTPTNTEITEFTLSQDNIYSGTNTETTYLLTNLTIKQELITNNSNQTETKVSINLNPSYFFYNNEKINFINATKQETITPPTHNITLKPTETILYQFTIKLIEFKKQNDIPTIPNGKIYTFKINYEYYFVSNDYEDITIYRGEQTYTKENQNPTDTITNGTYTIDQYIFLNGDFYNNLLEPITTKIQAAYTEGLTDGTATGYENGYNAGYGIGYNDSEAFNHPIALQPLMLNVLTMPFTFISQAFDVTLWPGTQYQFNIANFIKGMIAIATIMFIIKLFTSGFSIIGNYTSNIRNESNIRSAQRQKNRASKMHKPSKEKKE